MSNVKVLKPVKIVKIYYELSGGNEYSFEVGRNCDEIEVWNDADGIRYAEIFKDDSMISLLTNKVILKIDYEEL